MLSASGDTAKHNNIHSVKYEMNCNIGESIKHISQITRKVTYRTNAKNYANNLIQFFRALLNACHFATSHFLL